MYSYASSVAFLILCLDLFNPFYWFPFKTKHTVGSEHMSDAVLVLYRNALAAMSKARTKESKNKHPLAHAPKENVIQSVAMISVTVNCFLVPKSKYTRTITFEPSREVLAMSVNSLSVVPLGRISAFEEGFVLTELPLANRPFLLP